MPVDITALFDEVYEFVAERTVEPVAWPAFARIVRHMSETRCEPPSVYTDTFPALACVAAGGVASHAVPLAAGWVLYILAGRIFDDRLDGEGETALWNQAGPDEALSLGLCALGGANTAISHLEVEAGTGQAIIRAFGRVLMLSARAQSERPVLESLTTEWYLRHNAAKTGLVFATAASAGATVAGAPAQTVDALHQFGLNLGMTIQIVDDCDDLADGDLLGGVYTLPLIYGLAQKDDLRAAQLRALLQRSKGNQGKGEVWAESVMEAARLIEEMGGVKWSRQVAAAYNRQALAALATLPEEDTRPLREYATGEYAHRA